MPDKTGFQVEEARPQTYPRQLEWIQQIEISSHCNLKCKYCPSPNLGRPKVNISFYNFEKALGWAVHLKDRFSIPSYDRRHIWLHGIGESLMHPEVVELCLMARKALPSVQLLMASNGLLLTDEIAKGLQKAKVELDITAHVPKAAYGVEIAAKYNILRAVTCSPVSSPTNWAGQVEWPNPLRAAKLPCAWLQRGWSMVLATGHFATCCIDADGSSKVGHVEMDLESKITLKPWRLCEPCHLSP